MTVIIAYSTPELAFLAADSFRWDLVQQRNLGPVQKLHMVDPRNAFAVGGALIDRSRLANELIKARCSGEPFADAARRLSPFLFAETRATMRSNAFNGEQFCISWYAEAGSEGCRIDRHRLPDDRIDTIDGLDLMGPDTKWLAGVAAKMMDQAIHQGQGALDELAFQLIGAAAARHPRNVGYPAMALILRRDGSATLRDDLHPAQWSGPQSEFTVDLTR